MLILIAACLLLSVIAAFSDKEGRVVGSLAQTAFAYGLIFAVMFMNNAGTYSLRGSWLCVFAALAWTIYQFSRSDTRWR